MKVSRDQVDKTKTKLMTKLKNEYKFKLKRTQFSPLGLTFLERPGKSLGELEEFEKGLFEPQDEASQLVALQVDCMVVLFSNFSQANKYWTSVQAQVVNHLPLDLL